MKITSENYNHFAFNFMLSLARVTDNSDGYVELFHKGISIGVIQPQTKDYWNLRDILKYYRWEDYPRGYGDMCCMWLDDICIYFDEFKERWI